MKSEPQTREEWAFEAADLRARLKEAEEILHAIRSGDVDAVLVEGPRGDQLFSLKGSDEPYRVLIEEMNEGAVTLSAAGAILFCNRRFAELVQRPIEQIIGFAFDLLVAPEERATFHSMLALGSTSGSTGEITLSGLDGCAIPVRLALSRLPADSAAAICLIATDISESKQVEAELKTRELRLSEAQELAHLGSWEWEIETNEIRWSDELYRIYRFDRAGFVPSYESYVNQVHLEDRACVIERLQAALRNKGSFDYDHRIICGDGTEGVIQVRGRIVPDEEGAPVKFVGTSQDITARKHAEEAMENLRRRHKTILDSVGEGIQGIDAEGRIIFENPAATRLLGWEERGLLGQHAHAMMHHTKASGEPYPRSECPIHATLRDGVVRRVEDEVFWRKDGTSFPVEYTTTPVRDEQGLVYGAVVAFRDATERKRTQAALLETAHELEAAVHANDLIMENSRDVICTFDGAGRFASISAACDALWGYKPSELIGQPYIDMVHPDDRPKTSGVAAAIIAGGAVSDFENRYIRKDGSLINMMWSSYWSEADQVMFAVAHDNTERARIGQALEEAKEEAERANAAKSEFLSRMSHELRTPMNAILGFAQLLALEDLETDQRDALGHIMKGGEHLLKLINEVLDISWIEAGRLSLSCEPVEIAEAMREVIDLMQPLATAADVRLNLTHAGTTYVLADQQRVQQVFINLVSNAIKYNRPGGSVNLTCELSRDRVRISVKDTGIGIPEEHLEQLFSPFERLGAEQGEIEGTGLGLTVTKRLVEAMEGTIGVESKAGEGSTFWIELARTESPLDSERPLPASQVESITWGASGTVLYIEDNFSNLKLIERLFRLRPALTLIAARDGRSGLEMARAQQPALILLDLNLPDMNGRDVLTRLRAEPQTSAIPVIALSADATPGQIERLLRAGAADYLTKPINVEKFLQSLDRTLNGKAQPPPGARVREIAPAFAGEAQL